MLYQQKAMVIIGKNDFIYLSIYLSIYLLNNKLKLIRWRCKNNNCNSGNFYGSGLDDYPRQDRISISKSHIDLNVWIYFMADSMGKISDFLGFKDKLK